LSCYINADIEYRRPSVSYSTKIVQFCRQMSQHVSYETIFIWYGIRLQVNVVPQCRNTLQYVVSYVKFLKDFAQTKYCSSNERKIQIFVEYDTLDRIYKFETNRCKLAWLWATNVSSHNFRKKRCYILWWLFEELLKVFTWLVGFRYQLSIISALIRKYIANFRWKQVENLPCVVQ
jgi:hypothetical protein